jgi:predicted ArsR family transcriptional regulator
MERDSGDANPTGAALLSSPVRRSIVDALAEHEDTTAAEGMTAGQLAEMLDLHVTTVRFHLDQLVAAGLVSADFTKRFGVGRPRKVYSVAPGALDDTSPHPALQILTELLADSFGSEATPAEAGARWAHEHVPPDDTGPAESAGQWLTKVGRMIDVLHDWGYTPDLTTSEGGRACRIDLVRCPFLELARTNPAVVCGIHRGLIKGAMEQLGESQTQVSLEPFVEPDRCQAQVRTRTPFRPRTVPNEETA